VRASEIVYCLNSDGLVVKNAEKCRRLARSAQSSDDAWRWKVRQCVWSPEKDCVFFQMTVYLKKMRTRTLNEQAVPVHSAATQLSWLCWF